VPTCDGVVRGYLRPGVIHGGADQFGRGPTELAVVGVGEVVARGCGDSSTVGTAVKGIDGDGGGGNSQGIVGFSGAGTANLVEEGGHGYG